MGIIFTPKGVYRPGASISGIVYLALFLVIDGCAPGSVVPPAKRTHGVYHVVRAGENLYRIGKAYDVGHDELARLNRLRHPSRIRAGQKIFIPGATRQLPVEVITPGEWATDGAQRAPAEPPLNLAGDRQFIWPLNGRINSLFGPRGANFHDGIDIGAPQGTPIRAIDGGEVLFSDRLRGYGNIVIVRHGSGFVSVYAHNERNLVREGQRVSRGETIAHVGSTGRVSGPHLHFEIRRHNRAEDPLHYMPRLCCLDGPDRVEAGG